KTYKDLAETLGTQSTFVLAMKQQMQIDHIRTQQHMLSQTQTDLFKLRMELAAQQKRDTASKPQVPDELVDSVLNSDPVVADYEAKLKKEEDRYQKAIQHYEDGDKNPRAKALRSQADQLRQAMSSYKDSQRSRVAEKMRAN